jgi:putative ABC transport system substrate-binding protein
MRRREFLAGFGGVVASSLPARAQQTTKLPVIGFMGAATPSAWGPWTAAFVKRLSELGWVDGKTIKIEYRWAEGSEERYAEIPGFLSQSVGIRPGKRHPQYQSW